MTAQQLIYETVVPLSSARHGKCSLEKGADFSFARSVNSVPLLAVEFAEAQSEYAIVFAGDANSTMPAVILGSRDEENLYLDAQNAWQAAYVPAFLRRYPFVFSRSDDGKAFSVCVDETFHGLNYQGRGNALFEADGKPSAFTQNVLKFLENYRIQFLRTQAFCSKLRALDLLHPMEVEFARPAGGKSALAGFLCVDRSKLKALSAKAVQELIKNDGLELIYLHLASLRNFTALRNRLKRQESAKSKAVPATGETEKAALAPGTPATWLTGHHQTQH